MLVLMKLDILASDIPVYEPPCLASIGSLAVGGTSLANPVQTTPNFSFNNPATLTQTSSTYLSYSADYFENGQSGNSDYYSQGLDKEDIPFRYVYRDKYKSSLYNYQNAQFGLVVKISKFLNKKDATADNYLLYKFKTKNIYVAVNSCDYYNSYIYDVNRNLGYRSGYIYESTAKQLYQYSNGGVLTIAYKDLLENLDIGINIFLIGTEYYNFDNVNVAYEPRAPSDYIYPVGNEATLDTKNIQVTGATFGATYKPPQIPELTYGASIQTIYTDTKVNKYSLVKLVSPLPLMTIGLGASWTYQNSNVEWVNSIDLVNITAKGQEVHNWFEDHVGSELKIYARRKHLFPILSLRAGYNRRRLAYGAELNLFENRMLYFGATSGTRNIGYGNKDNIVSISNAYYGGIGYIF